LKKNKHSKKTEITLDKYNNITTRKFKQCDEKIETLDKNLQGKIGNVESTVNVALKNNKESLYSIVTAFEMRIKD
jgi:polyhydroxyalkanoate synthesis regulator phasin